MVGKNLQVANNWLAMTGEQKLGGAAEYLIDSSEKCIWKLSFEF